MVMQSTGRRTRVPHSTGISQELLARMMRRRAMSYARIEYLPAVDKTEGRPLVKGAREHTVDVIKEGP